MVPSTPDWFGPTPAGCAAPAPNTQTRCASPPPRRSRRSSTPSTSAGWRFILTAAYSGLRWGELTGLRRRHISADGTTITVTGQLSEIKNKIELDAPPKTAAGKRTVTLPEVVAAVLVRHLDRFTEPESSALVFTSPEGEPLRRNNFRRRVWYPAVETVGLDGLRFHDLRHTGATLAAATGAPLRALMARLGHSTPAAALRYQHVIAGQDADIASNLDRIARKALGENE